MKSIYNDIPMAVEIIKVIKDFLDPRRTVTNLYEQRAILAHLEQPRWNQSMQREARALRERWGLPPEPDIQAAITELFITKNISNWEEVSRWREQVLEFLQSGAKGALKEVAENLHKQWEQGIPVVRGLIDGNDSQSLYDTFGRYGFVPHTAGYIVGFSKNEPVERKIGRLLDPFFERNEELSAAGAQLCQEQSIPLETGVAWGIRWGFVKRTTLNLVTPTAKTLRDETFRWLNDETTVTEALQRLTSSLELSYYGFQVD